MIEQADKTKMDLSSLRIHRDDDEGMGARPALKAVLLGTIVIVLIGAVLIGWRVWSAAVLPEVDVTRATVESGSSGIEILTATGYVVAHRKAAVSPKISGRLEHLAVDIGSRVKTNQIIGQLEHHDLDAQLADANGALANFEATKVQLEAELEQARASLAQSHANAERSSVELERQSKLVDKGVTTRSSYDTALAQARVDEAQVKSSEALIRSTQAKINSATAQISSAKARIQGIQVQLEYTNVRAPFDGLVISKDAEVGENVVPAIFGGASARGSIVTIIDPKTLEVEADINESTINRITMGLPAEISLDAIPGEKLPGETYQIVPTADRQKATVKVKVRFVKPDDRVLPDMNAKVVFIQAPDKSDSSTAASRVTVPKAAIQDRDGKKVVFVLTGDQVTQQSVTIGSESGDRFEIKQGLAGGEQIVVKGAETLSNGSKVKLAQR